MKIARIHRKTGTKYKAIVNLGNGKMKTKTFLTKRAATLWGTAQEKQFELTGLLGETITFDKLADKWLDQGGYQNSYLNYWRDKLADINIAEITTFQIRELMTAYRHDMPNVTHNRMKSCLSSILKLGVREGYLSDNPARLIAPKPEPDARSRVLSTDEIDRLLTACRASSNQQLYLYVLMLLTTAGRSSEVRFLEWERIDLDRRTGLLPKTKNGKPRILALTATVVDELRKIATDEGYLFDSPRNPGKPISFRKAWERALRDAQVTGVRPHDLRRTALTRLAESGAQLQDIALVAGHRSLQSSMVYIHLSNERSQTLVDSVLGDIGA